MSAQALAEIGRCIRDFDCKRLFIEELGWDHVSVPTLDVEVDDATFELTPVAEKAGMMFLRATSEVGVIPTAPVRRRIDRAVEKTYHEHLIVFVDRELCSQVWQWMRR